MKKYISYLISVWLLTTIVVACTDETTGSIVQDEQGVLTLKLSSKTLATRAVIGTEAGEDAWNENTIRSVDCFLYPNGKADDAAVFSVTGIAAGASTGTATISIKIPNDKIEALFGTAGNTCKAYVIVNRPVASTLGTDTSISGLKKTVIEAEGFATQNSVVTAQESFVMDGEQEITLSSDRKSVTGHIDLYRAASKISLFITKVEETVTDEAGNEWISQPDNMKVFFHNGVKKTHVDVSANGCAYTIQPEDYFNFSLSKETRGFEAVEAEDGSTDYYKHAPFYSYSSDWNNDAEHEAYLTLVVPWKKSGEGEFKSCYYQVPINIANKKFERNTYYKIKLSVGILGEFNPDAPVELNPSYIIVDWGSGEVTADIKEYRYLVVDKNYVVMDNVNEVSIPFLTSHEVELVDVKVTRPVLKNGKDNEFENINASKYALIANNTHHVITFTHDLNNNQSDKNNYDYVPYTITFTCRHKDIISIKEDITIVQYPALYVVASKNEGQPKSNKGYTYINNSQASGKDESLGGSNGLGSATNANPNMYVITTSAFIGGSKYVIGDPRSETINNNLGDSNNNWSAFVGRRRLSYYYPTDESDRTENMIAPKFRIASSYGVTYSKSYDAMRKRCASYQEYGYPAGRWRMPTKAELEYIVKLSAEKKIPKLFNDNSDETKGEYWCAHGIAYPQSSGEVLLKPKDSSSHAVRCVYDEWYWTDTVNKGTFTWGDKQR